MYNKPITGTVEATTPFAMGDGESGYRHGITITVTVPNAKVGIIKDIIGDFYEQAEKLFNEKFPISGNVDLKYTKREDLIVSFGDIQNVPCELSGIALNMGDDKQLKVKIKLADITEKIIGKVCVLLREEITFTIVTNNLDLQLTEKGPDGKESDFARELNQAMEVKDKPNKKADKRC